MLPMYNRSSMSRDPGKLVLHHRSKAVAFATLDGFFLMRCFGDVTPADVQATLLGHEAIIAYGAAGSRSLVAVDPTATFPSEATRRAFLDVMRKTSAQTLAHVLIVLGDGFWASAVRGTMMTIASLSPGTYPRKVVRYEEEAVDWILEPMGESKPIYRAALLAGLAQLKAGETEPRQASKPLL
jgi:hypothetical protein